MNDTLAGIIGLAIILAGIYIGWKILVASVWGLRSTGDNISNSWPSFFEKVWVSVIAGVVTGVIVSFATGGDLQWASATGIGVASIKFIYDIVQA